MSIAQGYGALSKGGAGGKILTVTSLKDTMSKGTLRWACSQTGARIVQFAVSGVIMLANELKITNPYITIDGSLGVKGNGIEICNHTLSIRTHDVILRYVRVRRGDISVLAANNAEGLCRPKNSDDLDGINIDHSQNVLVDHVSASWSADELVSVTNSENVTIQWCLLSEPLSNPAIHPYGNNHAFGSNNSASKVTYHHNVFYNIVMRGPQFEANDNEEDQGYYANFEAVNNLIYGYVDSGSRYSPGFEKSTDIVDKIKVNYQFVGNLYQTPVSDGPEIRCITDYDPVKNVKVYFKGNIGPHRPSNLLPETACVFGQNDKGERMNIVKLSNYAAQLHQDEPMFTPFVPVDAQDALTLPATLLDTVGCVGNGVVRDRVDNRVIEAIKARTMPAILKSQSLVEGFNMKKIFV